MKRLVCLALAVLILSGFAAPAAAAQKLAEDDISISAPSAVLMEKQTGEIIYEKNAYEHLSPASVTKVMTMLLVTEAIERGEISEDELVTASERAASMGGSQIWLEEGEQMSVSEMLKCVTVVSANDCCVALAEHLCGSEEAFVKRMNERAAELGMNDTHFTCCSGLLESDEHYSCAHDIALMSRELIMHDMIKQYTTVWMDTIRGGEFTLANTNKLIFHYNGATGLKTGFTSKAMYCLSATAERDGVEYIAVVLHADTTADRFESAKTLLNYAFANYSLCSLTGDAAIPPVAVELGMLDSVQPDCAEAPFALLKNSDAASVSYSLDLPQSVKAPISEGQVLGSLSVSVGGSLVKKVELISPCEVEKRGIFSIFNSIIGALVGE